jgi:hypothetical protein
VERYELPRLPVVITGLADEWPASVPPPSAPDTASCRPASAETAVGMHCCDRDEGRVPCPHQPWPRTCNNCEGAKAEGATPESAGGDFTRGWGLDALAARFGEHKFKVIACRASLALADATHLQ